MKYLLPSMFGSLVALVVAQTRPKAPLDWGDLNFIHTSDTHGWLLGHSKDSPPEPNYRGTLGDVASFIQHMNDTANDNKVDLLLIDSGDQHDGNGITDGQPLDLQLPLGHVATSYFKILNYSLLTLGNHELKDDAVFKDVYMDFAPYWGERYLSSNVNITIGNDNKSVGSRWTNFVTPHKKFNITSFSVTLQIKHEDLAPSARVQTVEDMFKEPWFKAAMGYTSDAFVLIGHTSVDSTDWDKVHDKVRETHKDVPIFIFGGHTHMRNCRFLPTGQTPKRAVAIESGKYLETVGWLSTNLSSAKPADNISISRRYLDGNRVTFMYHTGKNTDQDFDTPEGLTITRNMRSFSNRWGLSTILGYVPQDYYLDRHDYHNKTTLDSNLLQFYATQIVPTALVGTWNRTGYKYLFLGEWGVCRYDMLAGPFLKGDQYTISPYPQNFRYLRVPWKLAKPLNESFFTGVARRDVLSGSGPPDLSNDSAAWDVCSDAPYPSSQAILSGRLSQVEPTLGWVTNDSCGPEGSGDDTEHKLLTQFPPMPYMSHKNFKDDIMDTDEVDLITIDHLYKQIATQLNKLIGHPEFDLDYSKVPVYSNVLASEIIGNYVKMTWPNKP